LSQGSLFGFVAALSGGAGGARVWDCNIMGG